MASGMRQLAGTKTRYRRAHAAPLAKLISARVVGGGVVPPCVVASASQSICREANLRSWLRQILPMCVANRDDYFDAIQSCPPAIEIQESCAETADREDFAAKPNYVLENRRISCQATEFNKSQARTPGLRNRYERSPPIELFPHRVGSGILVSSFADRSDSGEF